MDDKYRMKTSAFDFETVSRVYAYTDEILHDKCTIVDSGEENKEAKSSDKGLNSDEVPGTMNTKQKISRAARRREKRACERKAYEEALSKMNTPGATTMRAKELICIEELLNQRGLCLYEVPSDGDCLYSSVAHQLQLRNRNDLLERNKHHSCVTFSGLSAAHKLRLLAAQHLRENASEFLPFMLSPKTGEPMDSDGFLEYCRSVEQPSTWGGQLEIRALAHALNTPIEIIQANGPSVIMGEEFADQIPIILVYHRHAYALGEHYNSVMKNV